jgi:hypothetical protein
MAVFGIKKVFRTALTDLKSSDFEGVGTLRFEGPNVYKWVQFSGTTSAAAVASVCYVTTDITLSTVDGALSALPAGIAVSAVAAGSAQWGWIQVVGVVTLVNTPSGGIAAGSVLYIGSTAGTLALITAATQLQIGQSVDGTKTASISFSL